MPYKFVCKNVDRLRQRIDQIKNNDPKWVRDLLSVLANIGMSLVKVYYQQTIDFFNNAFNEDFGLIDYTLEWKDNSVYVCCSGEKVLFLEFGSGIFYNRLPHPKGSELGIEIGQYPYAIHDPSWGNREGWFYYNDNGDKQFTRGIEASQGLYRASQEIRKNIDYVIKEVIRK